MARKITYRSLARYKYSLMEPHVAETGFEIAKAVATHHGWIRMGRAGRVTIKKAYAWDGPSGPTVDTKDFMRGALVHDALYQLMREKLLAQKMRKPADRLLWQMCREDGMSKLRADYVYHAVRAFGASSARPPKKRKEIRQTAP